MANTTNSAMVVEEIIRKGRALAARQVPWLAPAILRLPFRIVEGDYPPVACINEHGRITFNGDELRRKAESVDEDTIVRQVGFLWVHEVLHWVRDHFERGQAVGAMPDDTMNWNIACDLEINDWMPPSLQMYVATDGMRGVLPQDFGMQTGMHAEFYYERLKEMANEIKERIEGFMKDMDETEEQEQKEGDDGDETEKDDAVSKMEKEKIKREIAERINQEKRKGNTPASMSRWAEEVLKPKINWKRLLRTALQNGVRQAMKSRHDYSFRKPSRRATVYHPIVRPSLVNQYFDPPTIAVVVDTSASVTYKEIAMALAEVRAIWKTTEGKVIVIPCDVVAHDHIVIEKPQDWKKLEGKLVGGGGTDMPAGVEAAKQHKPHTIVVITDGYTDFPPPPQKDDPTTIWVIWANGNDNPPAPEPNKKTIVVIANEN